MKVKIKKKEEAKEYNVVDSWSEVKLEDWVKVIAAEEKVTSQAALENIEALSDIPEKLIKELSIENIAIILSHLSNVKDNADNSLKKIIKIDGIQYGFHPELSDLTLGEYADLETFLKNGIHDNLPEIMAILYRPITEKKNDVYTIEAYDGKISIRAEIMKKMNAEQVQGAMVFFWTFVKTFLEILPSSLKDLATLKMKGVM
jgi:predicted DNA-binding protein YlxM (UPF0122 family)|tara:strand:+ start:16 stop:621 length:606 start_codon:yes stop_codon:yes gene_type:complete